MAEPTDPRRTVARPGAISQVLTGLAQCLKWLILSLVFSVLIEWVGMALWWEEQGVAHSRQMLVNELQFLGADFHRSWLTAQPMQFASDLSERFYTIAFEWTGVTDFIQWVTPVPASEESGVRPILHRLYQPVTDYVLAGMQITQVFAVRLAILALATPVFGLFTLVALVDGLVRRDLRRWGGGRESSFVYHYAKKATIPLIFMAWVLYLALPFSLHPSWIILPFALAFAFAVTVTASTFKKVSVISDGSDSGKGGYSVSSEAMGTNSFVALSVAGKKVLECLVEGQYIMVEHIENDAGGGYALWVAGNMVGKSERIN